MSWRPYFTLGRHQLRVGVQRMVWQPPTTCPRHVICARTSKGFWRPEYRFIALEWQLWA